METLQGNDLWILRTFAKLKQFISVEHANPAEEFIALSKHINKMTYKNRNTTYRKVYFLLRDVVAQYKIGNEEFNQFFQTGKMQKAINEIASEYQELLAEASK